MELANGGAVDARAQHAQHGVVNLLLATAKLSSHGNRASQVGVVICVTGSHVHQQQLAFFTNLIVLKIVQHAVVFPGGDDRRVGEFAAAADELARPFGLHLVLGHARLHEAQCAAESFGSNIDRLIQ